MKVKVLILTSALFILLSGCSSTSESNYLSACEKHFLKSVTGDIAKEVCKCSTTAYNQISEGSKEILIGNLTNGTNNNFATMKDTKIYMTAIMNCSTSAVKKLK